MTAMNFVVSAVIVYCKWTLNQIDKDEDDIFVAKNVANLHFSWHVLRIRPNMIKRLVCITWNQVI